MAQALRKQSFEEQAQQLLTQTRLTDNEWKLLERKASRHYDKSLSPNTRSEQTVVHRGFAKEAAYKLRNHPPAQVTALNLLARIALDEGFYQLSEHHLNEALKLSPRNAGCWYSLGHVHLALKKYDQALTCFSTAMDINPNLTRAASSLAYTLAGQGRVVEAFQAYRNLFRLHPDDKHVQAKLFEIVPLIKADFYQNELADDVIEWLQVKNVNHQALAPLTISLLRHKYQLDDPNAVVDLQDLAKDPLLGMALFKMFFTDPEMEHFLTMVRKQTLLHSVSGGYQDITLLAFASNLAMHAGHNEHAWLYDDDEKGLVNGLHDLIAETLANPAARLREISHLLCLYAMYEPLMLVPGIERLITENTMDWPSYAQPLLRHAVQNAFEEIVISKGINQLGEIKNDISLSVKAQYEENPYPRWLHLGYNTPTNYGRALERELVNFRAPEFFNMGTIKVLVAGCGTGQHALRLARYFRNVEVLALDLSRRSLAYAKRMAEQYGIDNVRFLCGDILELDSLDEEFHVIECSGVLHHMQDPQAGLAMLKSKLAKRGLIKLGLYSFQARDIVRKMRSVITRYDVPASADGIRTLRQAILTGKMPYDFSGILSSPDFYSLSGCRDLLFHVQEYQYEPQELKSLIEHENLNFLGFVVNDDIRANYRQQFPEDQALTNLDNWQLFEAQAPTTFAGMFQFYVQA